MEIGLWALAAGIEPGCPQGCRSLAR